MNSNEINNLHQNNKVQHSEYKLINSEVDAIIDNQDKEVSEYINTNNAVLCKNNLKELLEKSEGGELKSGTRKIIAEMLTNREEYTKLKLDGDKNFLLDLREKYKAQSKWYSDVISKLNETVTKKDNLKTADNPGWFSIKSNSNGKEKSINYKIYKTIALQDYTYIQYILNLSEKLEQISNKSQDPISLKVPYNFLGFYSHNDSMVIHFKNIENKELIENTINEWINEFGIQEDKRQLGRSKFSLDSKDTSFSYLVGENIEKWLRENFGKYENSILIDMAFEYAIKQSQVIPIIKKDY